MKKKTKIIKAYAILEKPGMIMFNASEYNQMEIYKTKFAAQCQIEDHMNVEIVPIEIKLV